MAGFDSPDLDKLLEQTTISKSIAQITTDYRCIHAMLTDLNIDPILDGMMDLTLSIVCDAYNKEIADKPQPKSHIPHRPGRIR